MTAETEAATGSPTARTAAALTSSSSPGHGRSRRSARRIWPRLSPGSPPERDSEAQERANGSRGRPRRLRTSTTSVGCSAVAQRRQAHSEGEDDHGHA